MAEQIQQQVDIYALVDAYKDLLDTKDELKELTTENNKAITEARSALAQAMIDAESPRISRGGYMYSLGEKTEYSKRGCNEEDFFNFLRLRHRYSPSKVQFPEYLPLDYYIITYNFIKNNLAIKY